MKEEINSLLRINRQFTKSSGFRSHNVFCQAATGQKVKFLQYELIEISLIKILEKVETKLKSNDYNSHLYGLAMLWIGLISIHPFSNGNGRTTKMYLMTRVTRLGYNIESINDIDSILLTSETAQNIKNITNYLSHKIKIKEFV